MTIPALERLLEKDSGRPLLEKLHWMDFDGANFIVATNGQAITLSRQVERVGEELPVSKQVREWLDNASKRECEQVPRAAFATWFAELPDDDECDECDGSGDGVCHACGQSADCEKCGGYGKLGVMPAPGTIRGRMFNRQLVRKAIGGLLGDFVEVSVPDDRYEPTLFRAPNGGWISLVMAYREETEDNTPELLPGKPAVSPSRSESEECGRT